ncbi:MAG: extracellular solute-binding protein [Eubacteriales bacterium]|nr:extracellular solute-binding protein [Eubacteriales bacterium]
MKKSSFRKVLVGALAVAVMFSMSACGNSTGTADGNSSGDSSAQSDSGKTKLYVVNWKDYGTDDKELMKQFEEENDCEIVNTYMQSEDDLLTKLKTSGSGEIDVCLPNCTILPAAIEGDLLEPIDTSKLTNFNSLFDRFKTQKECLGDDGQMYAVPVVWGSTAVAYNTDNVKEAPTTIKCLFDEQYKGKIAFRDDYNDAIMTAALALGQDPNNPSDLDAIKELLLKQKSLNKTYWQTGDEFSKLFASGQIDVGLMWSGQSATMKKDGEPIGFVVPEDGGIGWVDNFAIPKNSKNKELALKFIDYMISKDVQYKWSSNGGPAPSNQEAANAIDPDYAQSAAMDEASLNRLTFMEYRDDKTKQEWNDLWTEVKAS